MWGSSERDAVSVARVGVAVSVGKEQRMNAFETVTSAMLAPVAPAIGLPLDAALPFAQLSTALAWGLNGALLGSVAALASQVEPVRIYFIRRVHAMRAAARRLLPPRRSRAGGSSGRVPPRSAAGSPPIRR